MKIKINAAARLQAAAPLSKVTQYFGQHGVKVSKLPPHAKFHFGPEKFTSVVALKSPYASAKADLTKALGEPTLVSITTGGLTGLRIVRGYQWGVNGGTVMIFASEALLTSGKTRPNIAVLLDESWKKPNQ